MCLFPELENARERGGCQNVNIFACSDTDEKGRTVTLWGSAYSNNRDWRYVHFAIDFWVYSPRGSRETLRKTERIEILPTGDWPRCQTHGNALWEELVKHRSICHLWTRIVKIKDMGVPQNFQTKKVVNRCVSIVWDQLTARSKAVHYPMKPGRDDRVSFDSPVLHLW